MKLERLDGRVRHWLCEVIGHKYTPMDMRGEDGEPVIAYMWCRRCGNVLDAFPRYQVIS